MSIALCYWLNNTITPPQRYIEVNPQPLELGSWKWSLCKCNQVKMRSLIQWDRCPYKKHHVKTHKEGRMPCDDSSRDFNVAGSSQGMPRIVANHQKLGRVRQDSPLQVSEGAWLVDTLI